VKSRPQFAVTLVVAAAIAGCGGGSTPVSADQLVAKGDELCRASQQSFSEIQAQPPANAGDAADQTGQLVAAAQQELDGLHDLQPPSELSHHYDAYLQAKQEALDLLEKGQGAAEKQDGNTYGALQKQIADGAAKRHQLAQAVGFTDCSNPAAEKAPAG
jgi:hypothetical protein